MEKNGTMSQSEAMVSLFCCDDERKRTILIIDDTPLIISALSQMLLPAFCVKAAKTGGDGLEIARRQKIDLIFLDIKMPEQDGFAVFEKLKQEKNIPIIFLSGTTEPEDKERGLALGAADFIEKPFAEEDVLQRVEKILGEW